MARNHFEMGTDSDTVTEDRNPYQPPPPEHCTVAISEALAIIGGHVHQAVRMLSANGVKANGREVVDLVKMIYAEQVREENS